MTSDTKHQVLYALYAEYQTDIPDMTCISHKTLGLDVQAFNAAMLKLQNEGYIQGFRWTPPDTMNARKLKAVDLQKVFLTGQGVEYVENLMEIEQSQSVKEKLKKFAMQAGLAGLSLLKDFAILKLGQI